MNQANGEDASFEDEFFEANLTELEHRHSLERAGRIAAGILIDLQDRGPLYLYVKERRARADQSLRDLVAADPHDAVAVALLQSKVNEYLDACIWIDKALETGAQAEAAIHEEFGVKNGEAQQD